LPKRLKASKSYVSVQFCSYLNFSGQDKAANNLLVESSTKGRRSKGIKDYEGCKICANYVQNMCRLRVQMNSTLCRIFTSIKSSLAGALGVQNREESHQQLAALAQLT
jgi:hypothetical protein